MQVVLADDLPGRESYWELAGCQKIVDHLSLEVGSESGGSFGEWAVDRVWY